MAALPGTKLDGNHASLQVRSSLTYGIWFWNFNL